MISAFSYQLIKVFALFIQRTTLLLFFFICMVFLVGLDWINSPNAGWYRPFLVAFGIIVASIFLQPKTDHEQL